MNIITTILDSAQNAAISHYRVLLFLSALWFMLAFLTGRRKRPMATLIYGITGILFAALGMYYFITALKSMRIFARIGAIAGMISMALLIILFVMLELSRRYLFHNQILDFTDHKQPDRRNINQRSRSGNGRYL